MSSKRDRRIRHGELITEAWNPVYGSDIAGSIDVQHEDGTTESVELRSLRMSKELANAIKHESQEIQRLRAYSMGDIRILASIDNTAQGRLMHLSVSRQDRLPSWPEMIAIKERFYPDDVAAVMVAPERENYVNVHVYTLHWWQLPEKWGMR
jgi:hypothetical protein